MYGFVDVSNMSDNEIKRLGQMDDGYEPRYVARRPQARVNRVAKVTINHNANDVWAAAVQAQSINGSYVKALSDETTATKTNKQIVGELLADPTQITQENRDKGQVVRQYFKGLTFKVLQGKVLSDFNNTAMQIAERDAITSNYDIAVIVSLPATYEKATKRDNIDRRINFASGGFLGNAGDKVSVEIEVVKQLWSTNWNVWFITGITDDDKVLFFSFKKQVEIGTRIKITGTVKGHRDNSTQLNRVKVI